MPAIRAFSLVFFVGSLPSSSMSTKAHSAYFRAAPILSASVTPPPLFPDDLPVMHAKNWLSLAPPARTHRFTAILKQPMHVLHGTDEYVSDVAQRLALEIGRAPCRERVCQYV